MENLFFLGVKGLMLNKSGEALMIYSDHIERDDKGSIEYWDFPGGVQEEGETDVQTLIREVYEETGLKDCFKINENIGFLKAKIRKPFQNVTAGIILSVYLCEIEKDVCVNLSIEHKKFEWVKMPEVFKRLEVKYTNESIKLVKNALNTKL